MQYLQITLHIILIGLIGYLIWIFRGLYIELQAANKHLEAMEQEITKDEERERW